MIEISLFKWQWQFPHLAFLCGPRSLVLEERMRAAMCATGECSAGPGVQASIHRVTCVLILIISTSDIKCYNGLYLSFYHR